MQKRVTFIEQLKKENLLINGTGHNLTRSAESRRTRDGLDSLPSQQGREMYKGTCINMSASNRQMKTIHIPNTFMSVPFLQHSALAPGHKHHLCSIANIYSTEYMRQQMKRHYLKVLHTCIQSGQNPTCRRNVGHHNEKGWFTKDVEKEQAKMKLEGQRKSSSGTSYSDVFFPKILNR
ncbi:uncharacterized protein LOC121509218 [Cheilinus undulatus]|uniref:uncharacterized protein LOC121509218 n=1 Tax=Cheilinus undulatus TaxID=241271 RepID=UPI001BD4CFCF|nr:uncharacterized protein LOC121509218 [Cheilinus undulatus]